MQPAKVPCAELAVRHGFILRLQGVCLEALARSAIPTSLCRIKYPEPERSGYFVFSTRFTGFDVAGSGSCCNSCEDM